MSAESTPQEPTTARRPRVRLRLRLRHRRMLGLVAVALLVVAAHLGAGGLLLASSGPWKHGVAGVVLVVVLVHVAGVVHRVTVRRRGTTKPVARTAVDKT